MALLASDILNVCVSTLDDPNNSFWSQAELVLYLNQFCPWALGLKPDLNTQRAIVATVGGIYQSIPADGMQFIDTDFAGNGQSVIVLPLSDVKHSKFKNAATLTASANAQIVCPDPRNTKNFYVFPPSTGSGSTVGILYSQYPAKITAFGSTYPLPDETNDAAYWYVLALAFRKSGDRQDLERAATCYTNAMAWFGIRAKAQAAEAPGED